MVNGDKGSICRFTAQLVHATKFIRENKEAAETNARTWHSANQPTIVNLVVNKFGDSDYEDDEIEDACITCAHDLSTSAIDGKLIED